MSEWQTALSETEKEEAVKLLCGNAERLGVPYRWSSVLISLLCSLYDNGMMIGRSGSGKISGVLAYTSGTGEDQYRDRTKLEVHLLFIEKSLRNGRLLKDAMHSLAEKAMDSPDGISEIAFYAEPTARNRRLFGKFAALAHTTEHPCGLLDYYLTTPERLLSHSSRNGSCERGVMTRK